MYNIILQVRFPWLIIKSQMYGFYFLNQISAWLFLSLAWLFQFYEHCQQQGSLLLQAPTQKHPSCGLYIGILSEEYTNSNFVFRHLTRQWSLLLRVWLLSFYSNRWPRIEIYNNLGMELIIVILISLKLSLMT